MALLVHITSIELERRIKNNGIKPKKHGVVYFMPHMQDLLIAHQWARELKRSGIKNFAAINFKIADDELVWFGHYNQQHQQLPLNKAITQFMQIEDKLGYEFFIERKVEAKEVVSIHAIAKPMGWRYMPNAHGKKPCPCPACIEPGGFKVSKLKEKPEPRMSRLEAKHVIATSDDPDELSDAIYDLMGKWKKDSPNYLERLLSFDDEAMLLWTLAELLGEFRDPLAKEYLARLAQHADEDVRETAIESLEKLNKQ